MAACLLGFCKGVNNIVLTCQKLWTKKCIGSNKCFKSNQIKSFRVQGKLLAPMNPINSSVFEPFYCLQAALLYDMKHLFC